MLEEIKLQQVLPQEIEKRSFEIITEELGRVELDPLQAPIIKRAIHTSADFDYLEKVYRRYAGIPWDILTTERCLVRETGVEDLDAFYEIYAEPSVTQYTEGLYPERAQEEAWLKDYMENMYYFYNYGVWTICDKATGQIIGRAGFSNREGYEDPELGFVIGVPWQRQGYATEVCRALLKYGKEELGFERVQMLVMPGNETSLHLAENLGFQRLDQVTWKGILYQRLLRNLEKI